MNYIQILSTTLVILIHLYIMYLEMMLWTTKKGIKIFSLKSKKFAEETRVMAANQGLYNGFLAAGLLWSLFLNQENIALFFLICISVAGIYGAYSTKKIRIFYIQSIPAFVSILTFLIV